MTKINTDHLKELAETMDLIAQHQLDKASQIYYCVVKSVDDNQCTIVFNNKQYTVPYYGGKPTPNKTYAIFLPHNNMNESFVIGEVGDVASEDIVPISKGGTGATTAAQAANNLSVLPLGEVVTKIPENADLNDYDLPGAYAVKNNDIARTIVNIPDEYAGTLRVFASVGSNITASSNWKYLVQEYVVFNGRTYLRNGGSGSGATVTWNPWRIVVNSDDFPFSITRGGTGANNAATARANLAVPNMQTETYPALLPPDGNNSYIKVGKANSSFGLLPSQAGVKGSGHNFFGTQYWYWSEAYVDNYYGSWAGDTIPMDKGGTGAITAAQATKNLNVLPLGEVVTKISSGADLDDYIVPGVYAIGNSSTAATIANIPQQSAGTLRVFASAGAAITASSTWKYLIQEYIAYTGEKYQRYGESGSGTAVTWSVWHQQILDYGIGNVIKTAAFTSSSFTISANRYSYVDIPVSLSGFTPIGIVGITGSGNGNVTIVEFYLSADNTSVRIYAFNNTSSTLTVNYYRVKVLFVKSA